MFEWRRLSDLAAETLVSVIMSDHRGIITFVNREFENVFGWPSSEAVGRPLTVIIPESMREAHLAGVARLLATDKPQFLNQSVRLPAVSKLGREFIAEHFIIGEKRSGRWAFGAAIREVMPRRGDVSESEP